MMHAGTLISRIAGALCLGALACQPAVAPAPAPEPVAVELSAAARAVPAGEDAQVSLVVALAPGWSLELPDPAAEGFTLTLQGEEGPVNDRGRARRVRRYALSGPAGSAVVGLPPLRALGPQGAEQAVEVPPLFIDLGVTGPTGGPMDEALALAPPPPEPPYLWIGAGGLVVVGAGLSMLILAKLRGGRAEAAPLPPHARAAREWLEARAAGLDDQALAFALSEVLRRYIEAVSGWPATSATPREISAWMAEVGWLSPEARAQADRVLRATDLLKFARDGGGDAFFNQLEADFEGVLLASRPARAPHA